MNRRELTVFISGLLIGLLMMMGWQKTADANNFVYRTIYQAPDKLSHAHIDSMPAMNGTIQFDDSNQHTDDDHTSAKRLTNKIRVLCWVMTSEDNLNKKAIHVKATWAKRCNKVLFVSDSLNKEFPTINITVKHGRDHLTAKTMKVMSFITTAFDYIYKNNFNDFDWFMKVDDDTFVILENLRFLLMSYSPNDPIYFGHLFKPFVNQGYYSGGGGYVFSKEALKRFGNRKSKDCREDGGAEDVEIGKCMQKLGIKTADTRDRNLKTRFHCFDIYTHMRGSYPGWYLDYDAHGAKKGVTSISDYPITFHYIKPEEMYQYEYFVYHLRAYGIVSGHPAIMKVTTPPTTPGRPIITSKSILNITSH